MRAQDDGRGRVGVVSGREVKAVPPVESRVWEWDIGRYAGSARSCFPTACGRIGFRLGGSSNLGEEEDGEQSCASKRVESSVHCFVSLIAAGGQREAVGMGCQSNTHRTDIGCWFRDTDEFGRNYDWPCPLIRDRLA